MRLEAPSRRHAGVRREGLDRQVLMAVAATATHHDIVVLGLAAATASCHQGGVALLRTQASCVGRPEEP